MLADSLFFICGEEVNAIFGVISYNANMVYERMHSRFRVVKQVHYDIIFGFDWLQHINA